MGSHVQTGLAACFSLDEYDRDIIKKHERTRRDKEDDRTRHMLALGAQTGPVFLTYRASAEVDRDRRDGDAGRAALRLHRARRRAAHAVAGRRRRSRRAGRRVRRASRRSTSPTAIIARRAPRARAPRCATRGTAGTSLGDGADASTHAGGGVPARPGADPAVQPRGEGSRRPVARRVPGGGARALRRRGRARRRRRRAATSRCTSQGAWHTLRPRVAPDPADPIGSLDVSVLQERPAGAGAEDRRRAHRQADRLRRRRARHGGARDSWSTRARPRSRFRCSRSASPT